MLKNTYYTHGKNRYKDHSFSAQEWSAPIMTSPNEIRNLISSFRLEGRKIKRMKMIGLAYNLCREWIEEVAYNFYDNLPEEERQEKSEYSRINGSVPYVRYAEMDEPLMIGFEDGDVFEIDTPMAAEFRMSMNCIPWWISAGTNLPNADAELLFEPCIGRTITSVEVHTYVTDKDQICNTRPLDGENSCMELVSAITLHFENGTGLRIEGCFDYCYVTFLNCSGCGDTILFEELKPALFNWEDLHVDPFSGYKANSEVFHFGEFGAKHTEAPYITLIPGKKDTSLHIAVSDFILFEWSVSHYIGRCFDIYGEYEFTKNEWDAVLAEAEKLVSFDSFDDTFEYVTGLIISEDQDSDDDYSDAMLNRINGCGAKFWKHIDRYRMQRQDMKTWSDLVLSHSDTMEIYGF